MRPTQLLTECKKEALKYLYPLIEGSRIKKTYEVFHGYITIYCGVAPNVCQICWYKAKWKWSITQKNRLAEIKVLTLVIDCNKNYYCPAERLRETAVRIPDARLVLTKAKVTMTMGKEFDEDFLEFLNE